MKIAALGGVGVAGMDAVLIPPSGLGTDGSQFPASRLAAGVRVGFVEVACESVARCLGRSRAASRSLPGRVTSRPLNRLSAGCCVISERAR